MRGIPEALAAALNNTPAEFMRYVLPGLIGRAARTKRSASEQETAEADTAQDPTAGYATNGSDGAEQETAEPDMASMQGAGVDSHSI